MKRIFAGILVLLLRFQPFANAQGEAHSLIEEGLCLERMISLAGSVTVRRSYYDSGGEVYFSTLQYADIDENGSLLIVYEDSDGNVEILTEGLSMGYDAWSVEMYEMVFLMDEYDENIKMMKESFFCDVLLNEKIIWDETVNGKREVVTNTATNASEDQSTRRMKYVFDEKTGLLECVTDSYMHPDATVEVISRTVVSYGESYVIPEAFRAIVNPQSTRMITVFPEEEGEPVCITAPRDVCVLFVYPEECVLYEDEARTMMFAGEQADENGLYPEETKIYIGSF